MKVIDKLRGAIGRSKLYFKRRAPTILSFAAVAGVGVTAVLAAKAAPKAERIRKERERNDKYETAKTAVSAVSVYIPAVVVGISTASCILGANVLNKRRQAALVSAYVLLNEAHKEYKKKAVELFGSDACSKIHEELAKDRYDEEKPDISDGEKILFYEEYYGDYFESTKEQVLLAEYHFNRNFALRGYAELNEFYEFLGLPKTEAGSVLGWSLDAGEEYYGYSWIDFEHDIVTLDDGLECCLISMPFPPTADYMSMY